MKKSYGIIILAVVAIVIIFSLITILTGVYSLLKWLSPILLIAALILNYKVVGNYFKWLLNKIKTDTTNGVLYGILSFIGFPFLTGFWFFRALTSYLDKKNIEKEQPGDYINYEEVKTDDEDFLELPELEMPEQQSKSSGNDYEDLFEE